MTKPSKPQNKISIYLSDDDLAWLPAQAERLDRSVSWIIRRALNIARKDIEGLGGLPQDVVFKIGQSEIKGEMK